MSNYSQITSFTPKDSLPTGNPSKVIMGADFDGEFNAISVAVATKADTTAVSSLTSTVSALSTTVSALDTEVGTKQDALVSGTSIKTINSTSLLGSGNIAVGTGDVVGPATTTDNTLTRYDGATGKLIQSSSATLDDSAGLAGITSMNGGQLAGLRNKIINGKMDIAQRGSTFTSPASGDLTLDRWLWANTSSGAVTISQQADAPTSNEFQNSLRVAVTTADTSIASGDLGIVIQRIEGYNVRDLIGKTFSISFWVRSSKTGVHCFALANSGSDRSYVAEYTVSAANTWEQKSITITGGLPTAGTWNWTNGVGLRVHWALTAGATYQGAAGSWQSANYLCTANQVNCLDTIGNIFAITGVQLEVGSVATPFEHRPYGMELAMCQRYFEKSYNQSSAPGALIGTDAWYFLATATKMATPVSFRVTKRAVPSITFYSPVTGSAGFCRDQTASADRAVVTAAIVGENSFGIYASLGITSGNEHAAHWTASAEL